MSTIRTGNHWRVTIVHDGTQPADASGHRPDARLLAVVMAGKVLTTDPELAERVAALLNDAHTPDVDWTRGAAEAIAHIADRIADLDGTVITMRTLRQLLEAASAELVADEKAPPARTIQPQSAADASGVGVGMQAGHLRPQRSN